MAEQRQYQHMSVKAIRGTEARTIAKWKTQGWELEHQNPGTLRTELSFRKPKPRGLFDRLAQIASQRSASFRGLSPVTQRRILGGLAGLVAVLVAVGVIAGISSAGADRAPQTGTSTKEPGASAPVKAPASEEPKATPTKAPEGSVDAALTLKNSKEFRELLAVGDYCSGTVARFASRNEGRTIIFDGAVADVAPHGDYDTRFDYLLSPGGIESTRGPAFQFRDVNYLDLKLTGKNIPDSVPEGTRLRITAQVDQYEARSCLFLLEPVSTQAR